MHCIYTPSHNRSFDKKWSNLEVSDNTCIKKINSRLVLRKKLRSIFLKMSKSDQFPGKFILKKRKKNVGQILVLELYFFKLNAWFAERQYDWLFNIWFFNLTSNFISWALWHEIHAHTNEIFVLHPKWFVHDPIPFHCVIPRYCWKKCMEKIFILIVGLFW